MIEFTPFRNIEVISDNLRYKTSIDTLRKTVNKSTLNKYLTQKDFSVKQIKANSRISATAKRMLWTKKTTSLKQIITPRFKNIILTTPHHINQVSDYRKCNIIAFGLSQPRNPLHVETQQELQQLFNKFKVDSFDLSIDTPYTLNTKLLSYFGETTSKYSTIYVNKPNSLRNITKICYYDKALKDNLSSPLYRLELTIKTIGKLDEIFVPNDEIKLILGHIF